MKITMLGTGNALVTECYNTCFILSEGEKIFLIDAGGGNLILHQIKHAGFELSNIHEIFVTHKHIDHILGMIWLIRIIAQHMNRNIYVGNANIYANDDVIETLTDICKKLLLPYQFNFIGKRINLIEVHNGEIKNIIGHDTRFFDIHSNRTKQFGFNIFLNDCKKLTCCGDEPFHESYYDYAKNSEWLLHEAFCLYSEAEIFKPYEKNHSTVKDACENAQILNAKNLLLYHSNDNNLENRKNLYVQEGRKFFNGNIFVPYDLESFYI